MNCKIREYLEYNENSDWWLMGRRDILLHLFLHYCSNTSNALDIGCGTGSFLKVLNGYIHKTVGVDTFDYGNNLVASAYNLPFNDNTFYNVFLLDVLEHVEDTSLVLSEVDRVLCPGGICFITVPALPWLYSIHDEENGHTRRYSKKELLDLVNFDRFEILKCSYFNTFLSLLFIFVRLIEKILNKRLFCLGSTFCGLNNLFYRIFRFESNFLKLLDFPFGTSLVLVLRKKDFIYDKLINAK